MRTLAALTLCSCLASAACVNGYPTITEEYSSSVMVLIGKVVALTAIPAEGDSYAGDTYTVIPVRVFKGNPDSKVDLFSENSSGRFPMQVNREYLLFIYEDRGRLMVDNCGSSDLMPNAKNALAQTLAAATHGSDSKVVLNTLHDANPAAVWSASSSKIADFDCDGRADTVMLGSEKGRVVVGVVWGSPNKPPQILTFPIGTPTQDGFNEQPKRIETFPLDCKYNGGQILPGCKTTPACRAFSIPDDDTDRFNFYWDSLHGTLEWWRH